MEVFELKSTVILGWAGIAGFSSTLGFSLLPLDLSALRAAVYENFIIKDWNQSSLGLI